ncbi:MAG: hypothetical protein D6714_08490 [Bacteroidetes bacterium]|nr:MAG: hypothetical protein D6714_08490 [Bacteroidota bacterium]
MCALPNNKNAFLNPGCIRTASLRCPTASRNMASFRLAFSGWMACAINSPPALLRTLALLGEIFTSVVKRVKLSFHTIFRVTTLTA